MADSIGEFLKDGLVELQNANQGLYAMDATPIQPAESPVAPAMETSSYESMIQQQAATVEMSGPSQDVDMSR